MRGEAAWAACWRARNNVGVESRLRTTVFVELPVVPFVSVLHGDKMLEKRLLLLTRWVVRVSLASQHLLSRHITTPEVC
jgi:hypothetical protein